MRAAIVTLITLASICLSLPTTAADDGPGSDNPLAPFERLVGGQWHLEGSYQEFEWGVGMLSVKARSYFVTGDEAKLVSEAVWFWHPGEKAIKGYATAVGMPVSFFDYTTRFDGDRMVSSLRAFAPGGGEQLYEEVFEFTGDDAYAWALYSASGDEKQEVMAGTYSRK